MLVAVLCSKLREFPMADRPLVSVIIATYNRAYILGECLESLACQTAAPDLFEVIVVDNNSTDNTAEVVDSFAGKVPQLRLIKEPRLGAGHARNAGIAVARGAWIACLDSDGKACSSWMEIILREIHKGNFDCFGGPYLAWHKYGPAPRWFSHTWETSIAAYAAYGVMPADTYLTSGTCAFSKQLAQSLGGFPTEIGMTGTRCAYGEETKLFKSMREAGARLGCVPDMLIDHCVLPYKYALRWRLASAYAHGRDAPHIFSFPVVWRTLVREGWHLLKAALQSPILVWRAWRQGHAWQRILLDCAGPLLARVGSVTTMVSLLLARKS